MGFLGIILLVIFVISALILIILVLLQDEQGEGLGGLFGGGSSSAFGSRSGTVLTKFTSIVGAAFLFCSFGLAWVNRTKDNTDVLSAVNRTTGVEQTQEDWWDTEEAPAQDTAADQPIQNADNGSQTE